jgi:AraC-like DNA-binding protein/CheY-like chemotaxis protein
MATTRTEDTDRFALVTAGHHFLLKVLPLREQESSDALASFVATLEQIRGTAADLDAVLLRCLAVLDTHEGRRIPSLVDRYLASTSTPDGSLGQFTRCVEDLLRYSCIVDGTVQQAVDVISARFAEPSLNPRTIAESVGARLSTLDVAFKREMACTITEYVRGVRLERAAKLLVTTNRTIKEIWAEMGYNHASNFDHDFKRRFGVSPREFRAKSIRPLAQKHFHAARRSPTDTGRVARPVANLLVIDDDECTRSTLSTSLSREGFFVSSAASGSEGLRQTHMTEPDAILVDYRIGDMDGLEFLRLLRRNTPGGPPAVALYTADWTLFDRHEEVNALDATVVSKLCDFPELLRVITALAERSKTAAQLRSREQPGAGSAAGGDVPDRGKRGSKVTACRMRGGARGDTPALLSSRRERRTSSGQSR